MSDSLVNPWMVTCLVPLSMRFPRQEYWSGLPFPFPGDLPDPGVKPVSPQWQVGSLPLSHHQEKKYVNIYVYVYMGFPCGSADKESSQNMGDLGSIPWSGRSPGEGNGNPFQYSCLENPMDGGAWQATVHGLQKIGQDWVTSLSLFIYIIAHGYIGVKFLYFIRIQFSSVQSLSLVWLSATPSIPAHQASLSITNSQSLLKLMSIESVMPSSHLILCCPLLLLPPIPPSIRVFSNESTLRMRWPKYWSFSFSIISSKEHPGLISFRMDWLDLLAVQGTLKSLLQHHSSKASVFWCSAFFTVQLSHPYMTTGKTIALTRRIWKRSVFIPIPKKGNAKECSHYRTIALFHMLVK